MDNLININQTYNSVALIYAKLTNKEFEDCTFRDCNFSNTDFSHNTFSDCEFIDCNLSNIIISNSFLKNTTFTNCKMIGMDFSTTEDFLFEVNFVDCNIDYAIFDSKKMPKTKFQNCSLKEISCIGTNFTNAIFENCNLDKAIFNSSILIGADFATSHHFTIDPEKNAIRKAKFSTNGLLGLLEKYDIKIV